MKWQERVGWMMFWFITTTAISYYYRDALVVTHWWTLPTFVQRGVSLTFILMGLRWLTGVDERKL